MVDARATHSSISFILAKDLGLATWRANKSINMQFAKANRKKQRGGISWDLEEWGIRACGEFCTIQDG